MERNLSHIYTPYSILFFILISLLSLFFNRESNADEIISTPISPVKVIDGDSLEIGTHRIRLMGIDAPEYTQFCKDKNKKSYPCGKESLEYLQNLIKDTPVKCIIHEKDKYDRDLCTCYVNNLNINAEMIHSGHAIVYMGEEYTLEQIKAKRAKRGIWQGRFIHPRLFRSLKQQQK